MPAMSSDVPFSSAVAPRVWYSRQVVSDSGTYRNVLQVSPTRIATLDETDLNELMAQLLRAQAYRCGSARDLVNAEIRAADDGCDGWSDRPATPDPWLGSTATCWQFKSGRSGEPRFLGAEVKKPIPLRTLRDGGRFVVVASGSNSGLKGIEDRQAQLITRGPRSRTIQRTLQSE